MDLGVSRYFSIFMKGFLWVFVVFAQIHGHRSCLEEERVGLLHLKAFLTSKTYYTGQLLLPSWVDNAKSECCGWERITCSSSTTGRVIELSLDNIKQNPYYYEDYYTEGTRENRWLLNVSLLQPFKELRSLGLSSNAIGGWIEDEGFEKLSSLRNLESLDLSYNCIDNNSILHSLGAVTSLKTFNLAQNGLGGYFPVQGSSFLFLHEDLIALRNLNKLDVSFNEYNGTLPMQGLERLAVLRNLETLNLACNSFDGSIMPSLSRIPSLKTLNLALNFVGERAIAEGFESWSRWENLETLDLSDNYVNNSFLQSFAAAKSLQNLNLARNVLRGSFPTQELSALKSLEKLDLSDNKLNGPVTTQDLVNFSKLEILDTSGNKCSGSISSYIRALPSLKALSLSNNEFKGTLPTQELCALKKLEELDLSGNHFQGILPPCMNNMTSLRLLDISKNQFSGNVSSSLIAGPTSLEYIDLSHNPFGGIFSFGLFANHSKLQVVRVISGNEKLEIETENPAGWNPLFQLKVLVLSNCNLNKLNGNIPKFLLDQHQLKILDLSHNQLKGGFPTWLLENNARLQILNLRNNSFMGQVHLLPHPFKGISQIDVSENQLDGQLQENVGMITPNLNYLNFSHNHFEGNLPASIGSMSYLRILDFSSNNFSGEVPKELIANCTSLEVLRLSHNRFHGEIFSDHFSLLSLWSLEMSNNQFTGTLSQVLTSCIYIQQLDISNNNMSHIIPKWIGSMTSLITLNMSNNLFEGQIPCELGSRVVDLSYNSLSGSLPSCLNLENVRHIFLQGNNFTGYIPRAVFHSTSLLTLDIRDNSFFGSIPIDINPLSNLRILLLRGNYFSGMIPDKLCLLKKISIMDLSKNSFSGTMPQCFHNIGFGKINATEFSYAESDATFVYGQLTDIYESVLKPHFEIFNLYAEYTIQVEVEFVTKYRSSSYKGGILDYMSGLDLSCNKLTGGIPLELGQLSLIHALNLSHNRLTGSIPETFSNLAMLESLDLSHNSLSGQIPSVLIDLNFLEVFSVAYNNLSGRVPDMKAQFGTFDKSSYEGNPFLCGLPLERSCTTVDERHPTSTKSPNVSHEKWYEVDPLVFFVTFSVSTIVFFFFTVSLLYIRPHWLQRCFNLIEDLLCCCYYSVVDTIRRLSNCLCH